MAVMRQQLLDDIERWLEQLDHQELGPTHIQGIAAKAFGRYEALLREALRRHVDRYFEGSFGDLSVQARIGNRNVEKLTQGELIRCYQELKTHSPAFQDIFAPVKDQLDQMRNIRNHRLKLGHDEPPEDVGVNVRQALAKMKELLSYHAWWC